LAGFIKCNIRIFFIFIFAQKLIVGGFHFICSLH